MRELKGKRVLIADDVISTGESLHSLVELAERAGGNIVCKSAVLAEGDAADRNDIIFLEKTSAVFQISLKRKMVYAGTAWAAGLIAAAFSGHLYIAVPAALISALLFKYCSVLI